MTPSRIRETLVTAMVLGLLVLWLFYSVRSESARTTNLRDDLVASCERGNDLREETNQVILSLQEFLEAAADAREGAGTPEDVLTAERYREIADELEPVEIANCQQIIRGE